MSIKIEKSPILDGVPAIEDGKITGSEIPVGVIRTPETVGKLTAMIEVTPELAEIYHKSQVRQRNLNADNVLYLMYEMEVNNWTATGESIKFSTDGRLKDGGHRLEAIKQLGKSIMLEVVGGLEADSIDFMDTGKKRGVADTLQVSNIDKANSVAAIITLLMKIEAGYFNPNRNGLIKNFPDNKEGRIYAEKNEKVILDALDLAGSWSQVAANAKVTNTTTMATMLLYLGKADKELANDFVFQMAKFSFDQDSPQNELYKWLRDCVNPAKLTVRCNKVEVLAGWVKAFNAWVNNERWTKASITTHDKASKKFPKPYVQESIS